VSHETIYRSLFIQARGALKKELLEHLRRTRVMRRSRHHTQKKENHGRIKDTVSISERPGRQPGKNRMDFGAQDRRQHRQQ
jgi:IS30 family transposase